MKNMLKIEEAGMFIASLFLFAQLPFAWWWYPALFLVPDFSMSGYLVGARTGAFCYNFFHHKFFAVALWAAGMLFHSESIQFWGILFFGHSSFDRMLGFGLKYADSFKHTHLGRMH
jgi:hypothetical protein